MRSDAKFMHMLVGAWMPTGCGSSKNLATMFAVSSSFTVQTDRKGHFMHFGQDRDFRAFDSPKA